MALEPAWARLQCNTVLSGIKNWADFPVHCSIDQKVVGSIPDQGTYSSCGFGPWL